MIEASSFKRGMCLKFRDAPMQIVHVSFSTPTARGGTTLAKTRMRKDCGLLNPNVLLLSSGLA